MKLIYNANLTVKFLGSFFIIIAALIGVGIFGIYNMGSINTDGQIMYTNNFLSTSYIQIINNNISDAQLFTQRMVTATSDTVVEENIKLLDTVATSNTDNLALYQKSVTADDDQVLCDRLSAAFTAYKAERAVLVDMARAGTFTEAQEYNVSTVSPLAQDVQDIVNEMIAYNLKTADASVTSANEHYISSRNVTIGIIAGVSLLALLIGIFMSSIISKGVDVVREASKQMASGDLTVVLPERYLQQKDEVGRLARNIDGMKHDLIQTITGIKASTDGLGEEITSVNHTLSELNDHITDASASTEELSAGMEETGASAQEMNATAAEIERAVENVAEKAEEGAGKSNEIHTRASDLGKNVNESIHKSNQIFNEIKSTLEKALEDSKAVDEINALADAILGITSQTTLLALNASIEAARAGEAGRGFAVVANEISSLADNSKNTVTQIQAITKVVMSAVNALASSSTNLLNFVSNDVMKDYQDMLDAANSYNTDAIYMSDMTSDLSATSEELLASVQVMMRAITEVAAAAQEGARTTSAVAEQTTEISVNTNVIVDAMKEAQSTSNELVHLVDKFKL